MFGLFLLVIVSIVIATGIVILFNQKSLAVTVGGLVFVIGVIFQSFTVISAGHTGVQVTLGEVNPQPLTEGVHFVNPISSVKDVDVRVQKAQLDGQSAGTKDLQQVHTDIVINYRMSPQNLPHIYKEFGLDIASKILGPAINDAFKAVTGRFTSEELITKRDIVSQEILVHLREKVSQFDIEVSNVSLVNFGFSEAYQAAIEQKVIATQQTAKAQQDLERIKIEAASRIAQADGEAKAIAIQAAAIQSNGGQNYVQLQWIEKWNGQLPSTVLNGNNGMMLNMGK
jgi:regulator of protease activity HflC (stomatin/prohibitin superfamily)